MLHNLYVKNLALIDELKWNLQGAEYFDRGSQAPKSVLVLSILHWGKYSADIIRKSAE